MDDRRGEPGVGIRPMDDIVPGMRVVDQRILHVLRHPVILDEDDMALVERLRQRLVAE